MKKETGKKEEKEGRKQGKGLGVRSVILPSGVSAEMP